MRLRLFTITMGLSLALSVVAQDVPATLEETLALGLPVIFINTENGEEPSCEYVAHPEGCLGSSINAEKIPGSVVRYSPEGVEEYNSGDYVSKTSGMKIKVRGNTSAYLARKPFKIKLEKKADLLNRGDKKYKDKNWVLLNDVNMYSYFGYELCESMGQPWTPAHEYVNVMLNGEFRGTYLLAEAVERNQDCRIDVAEDGYVVENDAYWWNENGEYVPSMVNWCNYTFKYPDYEDMSPDQLEYISSAIAEMEQSIKEGTYDKYIDCESFARWYLIHDILGTRDGAGANFYLTKYDATPASMFYCGLVWDFDSTRTYADRWAETRDVRYPQLFTSENKAFLKEYVNLWTEKWSDAYAHMMDVCNELESDKWDAYNKSIDATNKVFNMGFNKSTKMSPLMRNWYQQREQWLDPMIMAIEVPTAVEEIASDSKINFTIIGSTIMTDTPVLISVYTTEGSKIFEGKTSNYTLPGKGLYILRCGEQVKKILF